MADDLILPATSQNVETVEQGGSATTNATTAAGNATLHFAATPVYVRAGMVVNDTTSSVIPAGTTVLSVTATTVVMSANATGGGVGNGDTITFSAHRQVVMASGNTVVAPASAMTRPANTTAYSVGDLISNSTTAGSVTNFQFTVGRYNGGSGVVIGAQIQKTSNVITSASFRLHLFNNAPTYTAGGDNSLLSSVVVGSSAGYLGYIDVPVMVGFSDVSWGSGSPDNARGSIPYATVAQVLYGLLEARAAYGPASAEVFTPYLDVLQD